MVKVLTEQMIYESLDSVRKWIDPSLAHINIFRSKNNANLAIDCEISTISDTYCSIYISITPYCFDIYNGYISECDIRHDEFDFCEIVEAIISGRVDIVEKQYFRLFFTKELTVRLMTGQLFNSKSSDFRLFDSSKKIKPAIFKSYKIGE